jgi:acyl carrier protein
MVPSVFMTLDNLPLTHNGKIARKELPEPNRTRPFMEQVYIAPSNAFEKKLAEIWEQVLCLDRVGLYDNFFALGGTSILAVQLIEAMKQKFSIDLPIVKLFQYTDINSLAEYLSHNQNDSPSYEKIQNRAQRRRSAFAKNKR